MNIFYVITDANNEIIRSGRAPKENAEDLALEGETLHIVEELVNDKTHYYDGSKFIELEEGEANAAPTILTKFVEVGINTKVLGDLPTGMHVYIGSELRKAPNNGTVSYQAEQAGIITITAAPPKYFEPVTIEAVTLEEMRSRANATVDAEAEEARNRAITPGSGQAMTYLRKLEAARSFLRGETLPTAQLQRIKDEAARLGVSDAQAAQELVNIGDAWDALDAAIDNIRLKTKKKIDAMPSVANIVKELSDIKWPI